MFMKLKYYIHRIFNWNLTRCSNYKCCNYSNDKSDGKSYGCSWFCNSCLEAYKKFFDTEENNKQYDYVLQIWYEFNDRTKIIRGSWEEILKFLSDDYKIKIRKVDNEYTIKDINHKGCDIIFLVTKSEEYIEPTMRKKDED